MDTTAEESMDAKTEVMASEVTAPMDHGPISGYEALSDEANRLLEGWGWCRAAVCSDA